MVLHEGRSLLQHIADKRDLVAKQREDFTWMIIRIDQHIHPDSSSDRVDRVIQVLKDGIETSDFLHAWTESVKNKLPLPKPVMWLQNGAAEACYYYKAHFKMSLGASWHNAHHIFLSKVNFQQAKS